AQARLANPLEGAECAQAERETNQQVQLELLHNNQLDRGARPPRLHGPAPSPTRPLPGFEALLKLRCADPPVPLAEHAEARAPVSTRCRALDDSGRNSPIRRADTPARKRAFHSLKIGSGQVFNSE